MKHEYPFQIVWSPEDGAYIAMALQLEGCMADGATPEEALANLRLVIQEWIEVAKDEGRPVPEPMTILDLARQQNEAEAQFRKEIGTALEKVAQEVAAQVKGQTEMTPFGFPRRFETAHFGQPD